MSTYHGKIKIKILNIFLIVNEKFFQSVMKITDIKNISNEPVVIFSKNMVFKFLKYFR